MAPGDSIPEKRAPAPLDLVQRLINSIDLESGEDELTDPAALRDWLVQRGLIDEGVSVGPADLRRVLDVREGLRAMVGTHNGMEADAERLARLDRAAARATMRVEFRPGSEPELVPQREGVDGAIGRLMAIVAGAVEDGSWERLKACPRDECLWAFYDHSKNRSGRWCRMELCGNIEKARAFRQRQRGAH